MTHFFTLSPLSRWLGAGLLVAFLAVPVLGAMPWLQEPGPQNPGEGVSQESATQEPGKEVAQDPEVGKRLEAEGWKAFEAGSLEQAEERFLAAVAEDRWQAWRGCAEVARKQGDQESSIFAFDQLLQHAPDDHAARLDLARMLSWGGKHKEAKPHFQYLLEHAQDDDVRAAARQGLADLAAWSGSHHQAYRQYQQELEQSPDSFSSLKGIGELEFWKGRHDHAALHFRKALLLDPENQNLLGSLQEAERNSAPLALFQIQYFQDTADWKRTKVMTGFELSPDALKYPDWRFFFGTEYATFQQADGRTVSRRSIVTRQTLRPTPFSTLTLELAGGEAEDESSLRGGIGLEWEMENEITGWLSWRHDDFIDPIGPFSFDRYNSAFTVNLLHGDILQADTFRGGFFTMPEEGNGFLIDVLGGPIEDGNDRLETYAQVHRRIQHKHSWEGIGRAFYHHSSFNFSSPNYFSPSSLDSWGLGWRGEWERNLWSGYTDVSGFWQAGTVGSWGYQLAAGWEREWLTNLRTGIHGNYLSTDERGMEDRYGAFALMFLATLDF